MNWLVIAVLILFVIMMIHGWRKGFLRMLFSLVSILVLIGLVAFATPRVSGFLKEHTGVYTIIEEKCTQMIQNRLDDNPENAADEEISVTGISLPEKVSSYLTDDGGVTDVNIYQMMGERAADWILAGASFLIALIVAILLIRLIDKALGIVNHIPVLKGVNRTLGLFAGIFEGFILLSLFFLFVAIIAGTEPGKILTAYIDDNKIISYFYYQNMILRLFSF